MKKSIEREFVSIRKDRRADNHKDYYTVTWTPEPGDRRRKVFSGPNAESRAVVDADYIESLIQRGLFSLSKVPRSRLSIINTLCEKLPDDEGLTLLSLLQGHIKQAVVIGKTTTVQQAGEAYIKSRSSEGDFSQRHCQTVRSHIQRFVKTFGPRPVDAVQHAEIKHYLDESIGGAPKTRLQHLITIRAFFRWMRDVEKYLPYGTQTSAEQVQPPKVTRTEHEIYSAEEFIRLLVFTPTNLVQFYTLGQLAGVRAAERIRVTWKHWRKSEGNNLALTPDITKTGQRRLVDVMPSLESWLAAFQGEPDELMVPCKDPFQFTARIAKRAGVPSKNNALRAGYASYHLELFDNAALTAKNDGHTVPELETTYKSISGVTKKSAREIFDVTPQAVLDYAQTHNLPQPEWAHKFFEQIPELHPPISVEEADRVSQVGMAQKRGLTAPQPWDTVEPENQPLYGQSTIAG